MLATSYFPLPIQAIQETSTSGDGVLSLALLGFPESVLNVADLCHFEIRSGDPINYYYTGEDPSASEGNQIDADSVIGFLLKSHSALRKLRWISTGSTIYVVNLSRRN